MSQIENSLNGLQEQLQRIDFNLSSEQGQQLERFVSLLQAWNHRVNLVSRRDVQYLWMHHILPSILPLKLFPFEYGAWVLDIGSGGGLPAIPIKILRPDLPMVLLDSIRKKALFLRKVIQDLHLTQMIVQNQRVEKFLEKSEFRNKFDIVTARAVAPVHELVEWAMPLLGQKGRLLLWKGVSDLPELERAATIFEFKFEIIKPPEQIMKSSLKMKDLCWFSLELH